MVDVEINCSSERRMSNDSIGILVGSCSSIEDESGMIFYCLIFCISDISSDLSGNILFTGPNRTYCRTLHYWVFSNHFWSKLIAPINLVNSMVIGQNQQKLIVQIVWINGHSMIATISSISPGNDDSLTWGDVKSSDSSVEVQNIHISQIYLEVHNGHFVLAKEWSVHNSNGPWSERVID